MKNIKLVKLKDLEKISNKLGDTISILQTLEPFLSFKERYKFKSEKRRIYKYYRT